MKKKQYKYSIQDHASIYIKYIQNIDDFVNQWFIDCRTLTGIPEGISSHL